MEHPLVRDRFRHHSTVQARVEHTAWRGGAPCAPTATRAFMCHLTHLAIHVEDR